MAQRVPNSLIGRSFSHFRILAEIGSGTMGHVFEAEDTDLGRRVALKFLPMSLNEDHSAKARFLREARAASALDHPNVCPVYEVGEGPHRQLFLTMPLYQGETLTTRIRRGPLPIAEAVDIVRQVAAGLTCAHDLEIVHRDVKASNVFLTSTRDEGVEEGEVKLLDFGLAKAMDSSDTVTQTGALGSPAYMSPEQIEGIRVDRRSDLWSLGVMLYQTLSGQLPFQAKTLPGLLFTIHSREPTPLRELRPEISPRLELIVVRLLNKDPEERYATCRELIAALEHFDEPITESSRMPGWLLKVLRR